MMKVYDTINDVLSDKSIGGTKYANVTANYGSFIRNESQYIEDAILDKFGKLTSDKLGKKTLFGLGLPANLGENTKEAFKRLGDRKKSGVNFLKELEGIRMKELIKKAVLAGAASPLYPLAKRVPGEVRGALERS